MGNESSRHQQKAQLHMQNFESVGVHLKQANDWAKLVPLRRALRFVCILNCPDAALPLLWRLPNAVFVRVTKELKTSPNSPNSPNRPKSDGGKGQILSLRQFYFLYALLSDLHDCASHSLHFPSTNNNHNKRAKQHHSDDDDECDICMDKTKEVVLPCCHSFCLACFQNWTTVNQTCPICRGEINCNEGGELWELINSANTNEDLHSYAMDLVARIYEFLDVLEEKKISTSLTTPEHIRESGIRVMNAANKSTKPSNNQELKSSERATVIDSHVENEDSSQSVDEDYVYALSLAAEDDQYEVERQIRMLNTAI